MNYSYMGRSDTPDDIIGPDDPKDVTSKSSLLNITDDNFVPGIGSVLDTPFQNKVNYPDYIKTKIYESYDNIIANVTRTIEVAAGIIWDTHTRWLEFKNSNPVNYQDAVFKQYKTNIMKNNYWKFKDQRFLLSDSKVNKDSDRKLDLYDKEYINSFEYFYKMCGCIDKAYGDPQTLLGYENYIKTVGLLRKELHDNLPDNTKDIEFDIENSPEYFKLNIDSPILESVVFKIKPVLTGIDKLTEYDTDTVIPNVKFIISFDIRNLMLLILSRGPSIDSKRDVKPEDNTKSIIGYVDKDSYVADVMQKFAVIPEYTTKNICLELLATYTSVSQGFNTFINKIGCSCKKVHNDANYIYIENLVHHIYKMTGKGVAQNNYEQLNKTFYFDFDVFNNILSKFSDSDNNYDTDINDFVDNIISLASYQETLGESIEKIILVLFSKAFSVFFESSVSLDYSSILYNDRFQIINYTRELDKEYDFESLNIAANSISDYNIKDFFKNIIKYAHNMKLTHLCMDKLKNGENTSYIYSKYKRKIWIDLMCNFLAYAKLDEKYRSMIKEDGAKLDNTPETMALYHDMTLKINKLLSESMCELVQVLSKVGNQCGVPLDKSFCMYDYKSESHYFKKLNVEMYYVHSYLSDNFDIMNYKDKDGYDSLYNLITDFNNNHYSHEIMHRKENMVMSFDMMDLSDNSFAYGEIKNTSYYIHDVFRKTLIKLGLIDIEYM